MAKSSKSKSSKTKIEDAVELDVETSEVEEILADPQDTVESKNFDDATTVEGDIEEVTEDAGEIKEIFEDGVDEAPADPIVEPIAEPAQAKSGGFFPLLVGGLVAGGIGYGVATYFQADDGTAGLPAIVEEQAAQIAELQSRIDNLPAPDTTAIEAQVSDVSETVAGGLEDVATQLTDILGRLEQVERQPNADGTLSETALATYRAELDALRGELNEQQSAVMTAASQAEADLAAAREEAERLEQEALAAAEAAEARAAINRIATAVDTGAPFGDAIAGLDVPDALVAAAETGVATNAELTAEFPAVARAALATARAEGASDDAGGLGGFLRSQFDVRSTTPQEGSGPDAVLSRAEAAIKEGRVADALAEIDALPEVARAEITDWTAQAQERADVLDALATLSETYQ
ncbi:hypothetical protein N9O61_05375 [Octadecabacter sp.]|nr:hypothetical protein [Octadecabacter sp.]